MNFKIYELKTELNFGKYNGKKLSEVIKIQPSYINWCILNLDHFLVDDDDLEDFKKINSNFFFSTKALDKLEKKWDVWDRNEMREQESHDDWYQDIQSYDDWLKSEFGDEAGTAYWNMD